MKKVKFLFGIHCHQPVGNFEGVIEEAYQKSYLPFLELLVEHPNIKCSVHFSGILFDYFMDKHPEYLDMLKKLFDRRQIEFMTGGYYEPIIPIIPDRDKIGQISMMNKFLKEKFNANPRGAWLTERIWEPHLPKIFANLKIEYITVDDYHFISAGIPKERLLGYYITEEEGFTLKIFPINKTLRYLIPFRLPEETIKYLESISSESGSAAAILADDGEKFGVWPGTHKWVYEEKYLERLFKMFEESSDWIQFMTFSEYLDSLPPIGRIYLPTASYFEMMEWALPTESGKRLEKILEEIKKQGKFDDYNQFFKGGFFRNFFVKYPEANIMHKRMLEVSGKVQILEKEEKLNNVILDKVREYLYRGQCNCAYWHGIFGGLYLNYLRHAVYENLISAENLIEESFDKKLSIEIFDFDKDGKKEIKLSNKIFNVYVAPSYGGSIFEIDYKPEKFNLTNIIARREEVYHTKIREAVKQRSLEKGYPASIHETFKLKEEGLENALVYDWHNRFSLLDHFLDKNIKIEDFSKSTYRDLGDFTTEPYEFFVEEDKTNIFVTLSREGRVNGHPIQVKKRISLKKDSNFFEVLYQIKNLGKSKVDLIFGVEFNLSLLSGDSPDRYFLINGLKPGNPSMRSFGTCENVDSICLVDNWKAFNIELKFDKASSLWRFPIETVSQSESGFEKNYQGSCIFPNWRFTLSEQEVWENRIFFSIKGKE